MSQWLLIRSSVVLIAVIVMIDSATSQHFYWNTTNMQFDGDLITELTRVLTSIDAIANNLSVDSECWSELLGLSIGLQSNEPWALKCNYTSIIIVYYRTLTGSSDNSTFLIDIDCCVNWFTFGSVPFRRAGPGGSEFLFFCFVLLLLSKSAVRQTM